jgi:hypothetical protein
MDLLQRYNIAEGVPLCAEIHPRGAADAVKVLERYGHAALTSEASDKVIQFLYSEMMIKGADVGGVISNMMSENGFTSIETLEKNKRRYRNPSALALPDNQTKLQVSATNYALPNAEDTTYTWRKVYGAGGVSFNPNNSWNSNMTTVEFVDEKPGVYRFEVTMSDKYGYTECKKTVDVTLKTRWKKVLPDNKPPRANSLNGNAQSGIPLTITLSGSDPDEDELGFEITKTPSHGRLSGMVPDVVYTADLGYTGQDSFAFNALDGQGAASSGTVTLNVKTPKVAVSVYEGFDYAPGPFEGTGGSASVGLLGDWNVKSGQYDIAEGSGTYPALPSTGNMIYPINGHNRPVATRKIDPEVLRRDKLLEAGGELWFSFAMSLTKEDMDRANSGIQFGLQAGDDAERASVGVQLSRNMFKAVINGEMGGSRMNQYAGTTILPALVPHVLVGRCLWGKTDIDMDTVDIYRVVDVPGREPVMLKDPVSTFTGIVPQQELDTLYFKTKTTYSMDECRVGPTFESVLLGTMPFAR